MDDLAKALKKLGFGDDFVSSLLLLMVKYLSLEDIKKKKFVNKIANITKGLFYSFRNLFD
jgi:hypothetical protein